MKIILHADDFGYNKETTETTIECFERGALTSATIMANCEATDLAIEYAKKHPEFSWGVHLTYVDGLKPVSKDCLSLVDKDGLFFNSNYTRKRALTLSLKQTDIVNETISQIKVLKNAGIEVSHLDSHGHLHKFPSFLFAIKKAAEECNIKRVRGVQNIFINEQKRGIIGVLNDLFRIYIKKNHKSTDYFYMAANSFDTNWADAIISKIMNISNEKTIEVGIHPGKTEDWRINEFNDIIDFAIKLRDTHHKIINWNDV